ncbi:MAG: hypothetical protein ABW101_06125 [Candidatus Thiodiazotropha sp.]
MNTKAQSSMTLSILALTCSLSAMAAPPYSPDLITNGNRWEATAYLDSSLTHAQGNTQGICFFPNGLPGTHQSYRWVSDTFPGWDGMAAQEGDQIFMHGDFAILNADGTETDNAGHHGIEWEIFSVSPNNEGAGHSQEWIEDKGFGVVSQFVTVKFIRTGKCRYASAEEAMEANQQLERPVNEFGNYMASPFESLSKASD